MKFLVLKVYRRGLHDNGYIEQSHKSMNNLQIRIFRQTDRHGLKEKFKTDLQSDLPENQHEWKRKFRLSCLSVIMKKEVNEEDSGKNVRNSSENSHIEGNYTYNYNKTTYDEQLEIYLVR